jgi:hypothetical protein
VGVAVCMWHLIQPLWHAFGGLLHRCRLALGSAKGLRAGWQGWEHCAGRLCRPSMPLPNMPLLSFIILILVGQPARLLSVFLLLALHSLAGPEARGLS